ncbi:hypothetical protein [Streptomyces doebereineriae]|uniref:Uncharacterized protein n=1 Tax=Streptomyces doebereineriae TaxID=3075528 RepID=A0ABU2VGE5_9ACTN|nr:hypothetical protein [Streptomyces sp. DSM 41640]MDT0484643.1 hypothetical protein [Streptomyces sp. DSM 41640]
MSPTRLGDAWRRLQRAQRLGDGATSCAAVSACGQELQQLALAAFLTAGQTPHRQKVHEVTENQDGEGGPLKCQHRKIPLGVYLPDGRRRLNPSIGRAPASTMTPTM